MSTNEDRPEGAGAISPAMATVPDDAAESPPDARTGGPLLELAPEDYPDVSNLITEDGQPVDSIYVEKQYRLLTDPLESSWAGPPEGGPFVTLTNVGLFFAARNPPLVPDFLLSLGVTLPQDLLKKESHSYFAWLFGKPPDVVGEIVSDRRGGEATYKLREYARVGIRYYWIYDPSQLLSDAELRVFGLHPEGYVLLPDNVLGAIGLKLGLWQGTHVGVEARWLRWYDKEGRLIPTGRERADQERQRADQQAERLQRLEAQLRSLGVEPSA